MPNMRTRKNRDRKNRNRSERNRMEGGAMMTTGTKAQVWHGNAKHTSGGLTRKDLMKTKRGRIVSRRKHAAGQKAIKTLRKMGYVAKKGSFKLFKKMRGGSKSNMDMMRGGSTSSFADLGLGKMGPM